MEGLDRGKFALYTLGSIVGFIVFIVLLAALFPNLDYNSAEDLIYIGYFGIFVLWVWAEFQRLKNLGQSGWLFLLNFIPLVNIGFFIYLLFTPAPPVSKAVVYKSQKVNQDEVEGYCPKCGTPRKQDDYFCPKCGHEFLKSVQLKSRASCEGFLSNQSTAVKHNRFGLIQ